jgi:hypothetical protein
MVAHHGDLTPHAHVPAEAGYIHGFVFREDLEDLKFDRVSNGLEDLCCVLHLVAGDVCGVRVHTANI